jgi:hypothetical protein
VATESKAAYDDDDNARVERVAKPIAMAKPISRIARHFGNNRCNAKQIATRIRALGFDLDHLVSEKLGWIELLGQA